jgi:thiol-disulfide isomerase/thioredoxin
MNRLLRAAGWGLVVAGLLAAWASAQSPSPTPTPPLGPVPGDVLPPFDAEGLDGRTKHVSYPKGATTVLLFFLSSCPTCHRMIPEWNSAYERKAKGLVVTGVLIDQEPPGFFMATPISFPVLRAPGKGWVHEGKDFRQTFKIERVPLTVRVAAGGKVEDAAMGLVDPIRLGELFRP